MIQAATAPEEPRRAKKSHGLARNAGPSIEPNIHAGVENLVHPAAFCSIAPMRCAMKSSEYAVTIQLTADKVIALKTSAVRHRAGVSRHRGESRCDAIFVSSAVV